MRGKADGSHVWFDPIGLHVQPGQTVRWTNRDPGNSHTVTSYHPDIFERPLRIPAGAKPWNSDYLLPNESFSQTFTVEGVYDYYCVPHEHAGMVGRIVVGAPAAVDAVSRNAGGRADTAAGSGAEGFSAGRGDRRKGRGASPDRDSGRGNVDMQMAVLRHQAELGALQR